ncbi:hypothetical protein YC2023_116248 [Brassica napus]
MSSPIKKRDLVNYPKLRPILCDCPSIDTKNHFRDDTWLRKYVLNGNETVVKALNFPTLFKLHNLKKFHIPRRMISRLATKAITACVLIDSNCKSSTVCSHANLSTTFKICVKFKNQLFFLKH